MPVISTSAWVLIMSETPNDENGWKQVLYTEAWKQYCHEDNLAHSSNKLFLSVHAVLVALLTLVTKPLIQAPTIDLFGVCIHGGVTVLGFLAVLVGVTSLALDQHWKSAISSGRAYINLRWCTAIVIENDINLGHIGLASIESNWRTYSNSKPEEKYHPFSDLEALSAIVLPHLPDTRGWGSMLKIVAVLEKVHWAILLGGMLLILMSISG